MVKVFIIGLPNQIRRRVEASLNSQGIVATSIAADRDKAGRMKLLPDPSQAVGKLREYCDFVEGGYDYAEIYVLPYTPIPPDVDDELDSLEDMGAEVVRFEMEEDGWPYLHAPKPKIDQPFLDGVFSSLIKEIVGEQKAEGEGETATALLPSVCVQRACEKTPNFIVVGNAIDQCDAIAPGRRGWVKEAIDALVEIVVLKGNVGESLEVFFQGRQLYLARSGGITVSLDVMLNGKKAHAVSTNDHLKKGDRTTPQAAVRIYYHLATVNEQFYVFLLYLGPHPERDLAYIHHLS